MLVPSLGALLVIGGLLFMASQTILHGRLSERRRRARGRTSPWSRGSAAAASASHDVAGPCPLGDWRWASVGDSGYLKFELTAMRSAQPDFAPAVQERALVNRMSRATPRAVIVSPPGNGDPKVRTPP